MKDAQDIEKIPLLEEGNAGEPQTSSSPSTFRRFPKLKGLICLATIYVIYTLALRAYIAKPEHLHKHKHKYSKSWALSAFGKQRPLTPKEAEELYLSIPDPATALLTSRLYATHAHLAGSRADRDDATVILELFQDAFGISSPVDPPIFPAGSSASRRATLGIPKLEHPAAWIDEYYPVMNTPLDRALAVLGADGGEVEWEADLVEDGDPRDPDAAAYRDAVPTFHGLSADGEAVGQVVYVNYGRKEDYDAIVEQGGNLTGKIVLARYGEVFRGLKIQAAQELGAAGVLIYDDPRDDGAVTVANGYAPYPEGPARNPTAVQRGSVQFISMYPGDPTTPGAPAYKNATRTEGENIPKIPSLPISWQNAQRLLGEISGGEPEAAFEMLGQPSEKKVKLVNHVDTKVIPIWNTMAVIPGHIKNETVLIGCHRDAWVMGAADPVSGTVSLHEVIRGYGYLLQSGWRPLRNVVFASWDAEEYGLIGSTEWAEDFPEWIKENVVTYINLDVSAVGSQWGAAGSPSLAHLIRGAALDIPHPNNPNKTLWDARQDAGKFHGGIEPEVVDLFMEHHKELVVEELGIQPLGSGSDFTPFLQHLGVASMDQGFGRTLYDPPYHYHSIYDSQRWQEKYGDPGFVRHVAVSKHLGLVALRLADSIILPLNTTHYTLKLNDYLDKVEDIAADLRQSTDFSNLRKAISRLQAASAALDEEKEEAERKFRELLDKLPRRGLSGHVRAHGHCGEARFGRVSLPGWIKKILRKIFGHGLPQGPIRKFIEAARRVQRVNTKLVAFERGFISEEGIKDREWYKHLGVAPGKWLGYGATTLPSITEALTIEGNATLAELEASRVSALVDKLTETIKV